MLVLKSQVASSSSITSSQTSAVESKDSKAIIQNSTPNFASLRVPSAVPKGVVRTRLSQIWRPSTTTSSAFSNSTAATLSTVPGASEFAVLYDEYKIDKIVVTVFFDNSTLAQANTLGVTALAYDVNTSGSYSITEALRAATRELLEMGFGSSQRLAVTRPKCRATASDESLPTWQPLSQIANHTWGRFILGSTYAPSAAIALNAVIDYHCSFRSRI